MQAFWTPRLGAVIIGLALAANADAQQIKISQVFGGGGNASAPYNRDYVELFNAGAVSVNIDGWSVQYAAATGSTWSSTTLPAATIPPGGYFLIQMTLTGTNGASLPMPDHTVGSAISMGATAGKVALVSNSTGLTGTCPAGAHIIDFVGFGTTPNCFEGTGPTPAPSNTTVILRGSDGCTDANDNATDFTAGAANPRNSATTLVPCPIPPGADLQLSAAADQTQATIGGNAVFTFTVLNLGPDPAPDAQIEFTIPADASYITSSPPGAPVGQSLTLVLGTLAPGASTQATVTLSPSAGTSLSLSGIASSTEADANAANNSAAAGSLLFDPARASLIVGVEDIAGELRAVDVESGAHQVLLVQEVSGLAADNENRRFFISDGDNLLIVPWDTMTPQLVGAIVGGAVDMDGLAWDPTRQKLLGSTTAQIYDINIDTAVGRSIRLIGGDFGGIDYDPATDRLFAVNNSTSTSNGLSGRGFYRVDPYGTEVTFLFPYPDRIPGTAETDIDGCAVGGGRLYGATDQMQWIYRYDQGSMMFLDPLPQALTADEGDSGATFAPELLNQSPGANVGVSVAGPADCLIIDGQSLVFTATIRNYGPEVATGAQLQITLPANGAFVSSTPPLVPVGNVLTLAAGDLAVGASAQVEVTLTTTTGPFYSVLAEATTTASDLLLLNNELTRDFRSQTIPSSQPVATAVLSTLPGSNTIPGMPGVLLTETNDPERIFRSPNGERWLLAFDTDMDTAQDKVLLRGDGTSFEVIVQEGVTPLPTGGFVAEFDEIYSILDNGDIAFTTDTDSSVAAGAHALKSLGGTLSVVAMQGQLNDLLFLNYDAFLESITLQNDGTTSFYAFFGASNPTPNTFLTDDGATILIRSDTTGPFNQLAPISETWDTIAFGGTDGQGTWMNPAGDKWTTRALLNGDEATDIILAVTDEVRIQEGFPVPGSSFTSNVSAINMNYIEPAGSDVYSYGSNADGQDWVWREGEILAATGEPIFAGATEVFEDNVYSQTWFLATGNCAGDYVIGGLTDSTDNASNAVVVLNNSRIVLRENDSIDIDGNGVFDDDAYVDIFRDDYAFLSNDGWLYHQVRVRRGESYCLGAPTDVGQALVRVRAYCPGDHNRDGDTTVPDIFAFLSDWFAGSRRADMDCSGGTEVPDIFAFLSYWVAPCSI